MKVSQCRWAKEQIEEFGYVSRNDAINHRITRLASRIRDLKETGMQIEGKREGGDYVYYVPLSTGQ
jgi:hypothetical protein